MKIKQILDKTTIDDKIINVGKEYRKTLVTALNAGLAFLIALYIKDVLQNLMILILNKLNITVTEGIMYQTISALVVVGICVLTIMFLRR